MSTTLLTKKVNLFVTFFQQTLIQIYGCVFIVKEDPQKAFVYKSSCLSACLSFFFVCLYDSLNACLTVRFCLFICLSFRLPACSFSCLSNCPLVFSSAHLPACSCLFAFLNVSVCLSASAFSSAHLPACSSVCLSASLNVGLTVRYCLFVCSYVCLSKCLSHCPLLSFRLPICFPVRPSVCLPH